MADNKLEILKAKALDAVKQRSKEQLQEVIEDSVRAFRNTENVTPEFKVTDELYQELSDPLEKEWLKRQVQKVPKIDYLIAALNRKGYTNVNYEPKGLSLLVSPRIVLALHEILEKPISERLKDRIDEDVNSFEFRIEAEVIGQDENVSDHLHITYLPEGKTWSFPISSKYAKSLEIQLMNWEAKGVLKEATNNQDEGKAQEVVVLGQQNPDSLGLLPFKEVFEEVNYEGKRWLQEMLLRVTVTHDLTIMLRKRGYVYGGGGDEINRAENDFYLKNLKLVARPPVVKEVLAKMSKVVPKKLKIALSEYNSNTHAFHIYPYGNEEGETFLVVTDGDLKVIYKNGCSEAHEIQQT